MWQLLAFHKSKGRQVWPFVRNLPYLCCHDGCPAVDTFRDSGVIWNSERWSGPLAGSSNNRIRPFLSIIAWVLMVIASQLHILQPSWYSFYVGSEKLQLRSSKFSFPLLGDDPSMTTMYIHLCITVVSWLIAVLKGMDPKNLRGKGLPVYKLYMRLSESGGASCQWPPSCWRSSFSN